MSNAAVGETIEDGKVVEDTENMSQVIIDNMKKQASQELDDILKELEAAHPGMTLRFGTSLGAGTGAAGSLVALSTLGVPGLSTIGVSTGLTAAGGLIGGGFIAGFGVLMAPIAALGAAGYAIAKKRKKANKMADIGLATKKICDIQSRLIQHKGFFQEELATIMSTLEMLTRPHIGATSIR